MSTTGGPSPRETGVPPTGEGAKSYLSMTTALIAINLVVFLMMAASSHHVLKFDGGLVLRWGGNYGPFTMGGQLWRLLSAMFVHIGLTHLLINIWCLYELGSLMEEIYGGPSTLLLYLLTGIAGGIASLARHPMVVSAGASGAIFGLTGILIMTLFWVKLSEPRRQLMIALASLLAFAAYNLIYGFLKGGVDNGAHLGGLVSGLLIGIAVGPGTRHREGVRWREGLVYGLALATLVVAFTAVRKARGAVVTIEAARRSVGRGDPDTAIRQLSSLRATNDSPRALSLLAAAYAQKKQYADVEKCYRRALQLDPGNFAARSGLAMVLADTGRLPDATKELQKVARLNPGAEGIWLQLGTFLQKQGRHVEAISDFQNAIALNPSSVRAEFRLGISEMNLRQYGAAIASFQKATRLAPNNYEVQIWLANAYQAAGRAKEASAAYLRAEQLRRPPLLGQSQSRAVHSILPGLGLQPIAPRDGSR